MNEELASILENITLEDFLDRESIDYKYSTGSSGKQINIKECPFCHHAKWKVFANYETGLGNCFSGSCDVRFNLFSFIRQSLEVDARHTIEYIKAMAMEYGYRPKRIREVSVSNPNKLVIPESLELPYKGKNLTYLSKRAIHSDVAKYFHLRYCKSGFYEYIGFNGENFKQNYSERVIVPIYDMDGDLVNFQGRDVTGAAEKKYLFPPGFSSTGKYLYNSHNAVKAEEVVIGEGVFDVFSLKVAMDEISYFSGIVPIATFGKSIADEQKNQFRVLKENGLKKVTFCWDSEKGAIESAIKAALDISMIGIETFVAILPKGKDPNESTGSQIREAMLNAPRINKLSATRMMIQLQQP